MKNRIHKFVSVILLIVYGALTLVIAPAHHHEIVSGSASEQMISQHDDAQDCSHHPIGVTSGCAICSVVTNTVTMTVNTVGYKIHPQLLQHYTSVYSVVALDIFSTNTRRGPPQLLA